MLSNTSTLSGPKVLPSSMRGRAAIAVSGPITATPSSNTSTSESNNYGIGETITERAQRHRHEGDYAIITFVRRLPHPIAAVWAATTDPEHRAV
jgi:hypothetical protein